jgi:hypothetical protein
MKHRWIFAQQAWLLTMTLTACLHPAILAGQTVNGDEDEPAALTLTPAVIMIKAKPGQTISQELTLWNNTGNELEFHMEAQDIVVRDGKRVFLPAGESEGSIARYASFSNEDLLALPRSSVSVRVTLTLPASPVPRAIACIFMGRSRMGSRQSVAMTASLGALFTFSLAGDFQIEKQPLQVLVDPGAGIITFRERLKNTGSDPVVPEGVIAVTNEKGTLIARMPVTSQRLLPGETLEFTAEQVGLPKTGNYKALFLVENQSAFVSNSAEFTVK